MGNCNSCKHKGRCYTVQSMLNVVFNGGLFTLGSRNIVTDEIAKLFGTYCISYEPEIVK